MASFSNMTVTNGGQDLIVRLLEDGKKLVFTSIAVGDGELSNGQTPGSMSQLVHEVRRLPIQTYNRENGIVYLTGRLATDILTEDLLHRELGIYVQDDETEILLAYGNAGSQYDFIPKAGTNVAIYKTIETSFQVSGLDPTFRDLPSDDLLSVDGFYSRINEILPEHVNNEIDALIPGLFCVGSVGELEPGCSPTVDLAYCSTLSKYLFSFAFPKNDIDLSNYQGALNLKDACGKNIISVSEGSIILGNGDFPMSLYGSEIHLISENCTGKVQISTPDFYLCGGDCGVASIWGMSFGIFNEGGQVMSSCHGAIAIGDPYANTKVDLYGYCSGGGGSVDLSDYSGVINLRDECGRNVLSAGCSHSGILLGNKSEDTYIDGSYIQLGTEDCGANIMLNGSTFLCAGNCGCFNVQAESIYLNGNIWAQDANGNQTIIACGGGITIGNPYGWSSVEIYGYSGGGDSCGVDLSNYQGPVHIADENGNVVIASNACGAGVWIGDYCSGGILIFGNTRMLDERGNSLVQLSERQIIFGDTNQPDCTEINFYGYSNKFCS